MVGITCIFCSEVTRQRFILKKVVDVQFRTSLLSGKVESSNNLQVSWLITTYYNIARIMDYFSPSSKLIDLGKWKSVDELPVCVLYSIYIYSQSSFLSSSLCDDTLLLTMLQISLRSNHKKSNPYITPMILNALRFK